MSGFPHGSRFAAVLNLHLSRKQVLEAILNRSELRLVGSGFRAALSRVHAGVPALEADGVGSVTAAQRIVAATNSRFDL
jgi:hypothetical protein